MNLWKTLFLLCTLVSPLAEAAFITDKLVAGLYDKPDNSTEPDRALPSGTPLEIISRKKGFTQIRLTNGDTGWVEARLVSKEKPARVMLLESQAQLASIRSKLAKTETRLKELTAGSADGKARNPTNQNSQLLQAQQQIERLKAQLAKRSDNGTTPASASRPKEDLDLNQAFERIDQLELALAEANTSASFNEVAIAAENRALRGRLNKVARLLDLSDLGDLSETEKATDDQMTLESLLIPGGALLLGLLIGGLLINLKHHLQPGYRI